MATVLDIINGALQELGVYGAGETVSADDQSVCLRALNNIAEAWRLENLTIFSTQNVTATLPAATTSLTIGDGEDFDIDARPVRLEGAYITVANLDYPLDVISKQQYNAIALKGLDGPWPRYAMYDTTYPDGTVFFWPRGACTVTLTVQIPLQQFTGASNTLFLPPGYERAFELTLAEEVATKFQAKLSPATAMKAANARRAIKRANLVVPQLNMGEPVFRERWLLGVP